MAHFRPSALQRPASLLTTPPHVGAAASASSSSAFAAASSPSASPTGHQHRHTGSVGSAGMSLSLQSSTLGGASSPAAGSLPLTLQGYPAYPSGSSPSPTFGLSSLPDEKEVISSNMSERLRLLMDILQTQPPSSSRDAPPKPARDPDLPPSPKPLFGTRPPPAALAMQRGFSLGSRQERDAAGELLPPRPNSPNALSSASASGASADNPFAYLQRTLGSRRDGPLCSGWLSMQKNAGKWKRYWCEYADGVLSYRIDDTTKKPMGSIQVAHCEAEITQLPPDKQHALRKQSADGSDIVEGVGRLTLERSATTPANQSSLPSIAGALPLHSAPIIPLSLLASQPLRAMSDYDEAYWRYLEDEQAFWCFKVMSSTRVFLFKTDNPGSPAALQAASSSNHPAAAVCGEELRNFFVYTIRQHLQAMFAGPSILTLPQLTSSASASPSDSPQRSPSPSATAMIFKQKNDCLVEISSLLHEQFIIQTNRYKLLQQALAKTGFQEDELPITSVRKEKSGVLCMEQQGGSASATPAAASSSSSSSSSADDATRWRDYYFVLFEGALFYYKDSKSTTPTGFITLRFASLVIEPKRLMKSEYVFHVVTPLRTICCKTKHPVALSEWLTVLEDTLVRYSKQTSMPRDGAVNFSFHKDGQLNNTGAAPVAKSSSLSSLINGGNGAPVTPNKNAKNGEPNTPNGASAGSTPSSDRKSSLTVLQNINKWINNEISSSTYNFQSLIQHPMGLEYFRKALRDDEIGVSKTAHAHLDFFLATHEYTTLFTSPTPPSPAEVILLANQIFTRFLTPAHPLEYLSEATEEQRGIIEDQLAMPTLTLWENVRAISIAILNGEFAEFKRTPEYASLNDILNKSVVEDKRDIDQFEATSSQLFLNKVKGQKKSKEIRLEKKKNVHTIGRDKSNMLVIEDSRVSRSHARVEYSDTQCEYIDLGSSCGSKLNGKPVLRAKLKPGDVIELGQSVLIFQVKKKKTLKASIADFITGNGTNKG